MFPPRRGVCASLALSDVLSDIDEGSCRSLHGTFSGSVHGYNASHVSVDPWTGCSVGAPPCTPSNSVNLRLLKDRYSWQWIDHYCQSARINTRLLHAQESHYRKAPTRQ